MSSRIGLSVAVVAVIAGMVVACGSNGATGPAGENGEAGPPGATGPTGPTGPAGEAGAPGATGATGATGPGGPTGPAGEAGAPAPVPDAGPADPASAYATATPIKHLVVIFGENVSFDHYFGTYPAAVNGPGEPPFKAAPTDAGPANNLVTPLDPTKGFAPNTSVPNLQTANPNTNANNGTGASGPFRLSPLQAATEDMSHAYENEQLADDKGQMDLFPLHTGSANTADPILPNQPNNTSAVMAYFDGNTVLALWNYAQAYALNDNTWTTTFGPSTPGAINLISGQTNGLANHTGTLTPSTAVPDGNGGYSLINDVDPIGDVCSTTSVQVTFAGKNVGDLLNAQGITWGWFQGGFDLSVTNANGTTGCNRKSAATVLDAVDPTEVDYIPHHAPFQYYTSTANPTHARPSSVQAIGHSLEADGKTPEPANHQYDANDFFSAVAANNIPAVSYLKAPGYQDGHPGYSDPIDEQAFIISVVNAVAQSPEWATTAIVITYDDSDGWYDHQAPPIVNLSATVSDALNEAPDGSTPGACNMGAQQGDAGAPPATPLNGTGGQPAQGRCGYGTRIPLLVVSPYAKQNYIDHTLVDQSSVLRFVEDNWLAKQRISGSFDGIAGTLENMMNL